MPRLVGVIALRDLQSAENCYGSLSKVGGRQVSAPGGGCALGTEHGSGVVVAGGRYFVHHLHMW